MLTRWAHRWRDLAVRGVLAIIFGIVALFWPRLTISLLLIFFGIYAAIDGAITIKTSFRLRRARKDWWVQLVQGLASFIIGVVMILWQTRSARLLLYGIAIWALIVGVFQIVQAYFIRREIRNEWSLALGGLLSVAIGIVLLALPIVIMGILGLVGTFILIMGILLLLFALRLRSIERAEAHRVTLPGR